MGLSMVVNGHQRVLEQLGEASPLSQVIAALELKPDRVAVELNGAIASRTQWNEIRVQTGDRLEIVHFVGGGSALAETCGLPGSSFKSVKLSWRGGRGRGE